MKASKNFRGMEGRTVFSAIGALAIASLASGCGPKTAADSAAGAPHAMPVQVQVVQSARIAETTEYLSVLKSRHSATINPQVEGQITRIFVKSGDRVKAGTALLQIDPLKQEATVASQEASRASAEATRQLAQVSLERAKKLFDAGVISKQELDSAQSAYDAANAQVLALDAQLRQQQVQLHYYRVTAPMDGIVGDIPVHTGDRVTVATPLTTIDEPGGLEAYIYIPAERSKDLKLGLPVRLTDDAGAPVAETRITFLSPQVETDTQTILVKAAAPNPQGRLRIAQQVRAQVTWGTHDGPLAPLLSVTRINGQFFAFVASHEGNGTVARQRLLKVGDIVGNDYAVLDGMKPGDHLIVSGTQFLQDGMPVTEQIQGASDASRGQAGAAK